MIRLTEKIYYNNGKRITIILKKKGNWAIMIDEKAFHVSLKLKSKEEIYCVNG